MRGDTTDNGWIDVETAQSNFKDERLAKRSQQLLLAMGGSMCDSISLACEDWANTKAAYACSNAPTIALGHLSRITERQPFIPGTKVVVRLCLFTTTQKNGFEAPVLAFER